jgi:hypothetical protein
MNERQTELIAAARKRAQIRREIRTEKDRIADQLDALCDEVERLCVDLTALKDARTKMDVANVLYAGLHAAAVNALAEYYLSDKPFPADRMKAILEGAGVVLPEYTRTDTVVHDEIGQLRQQVRTLQELYDAKVPLHERRKLPSPTTVSTLTEAETDPRMLFQQSFWPDCQCVECYAAHKAEEFYTDLLLAVKRLSQASACSGEGPDEALKWWDDKGKLQDKYLRTDETEE